MNDDDDDVPEGPVEWAGDPLRDTLTYRWIDNGRAALELAFLDEATYDRYEGWIARQDGESGIDETSGADQDGMMLEKWTSETGGAVILSAAPRRNEFVLSVISGGFEANVGLLFDPQTHELLAGTLHRFAGDPEAGLLGGSEFGEMIIEEEARLLGAGPDEDDETP